MSFSFKAFLIMIAKHFIRHWSKPREVIPFILIPGCHDDIAHIVDALFGTQAYSLPPLIIDFRWDSWWKFIVLWRFPRHRSLPHCSACLYNCATVAADTHRYRYPSASTICRSDRFHIRLSKFHIPLCDSLSISITPFYTDHLSKWIDDTSW
jgi:hypothetical protein